MLQQRLRQPQASVPLASPTRGERTLLRLLVRSFRRPSTVPTAERRAGQHDELLESSPAAICVWGSTCGHGCVAPMRPVILRLSRFPHARREDVPELRRVSRIPMVNRVVRHCAGLAGWTPLGCLTRWPVHGYQRPRFDQSAGRATSEEPPDACQRSQPGVQRLPQAGVAFDEVRSPSKSASAWISVNRVSRTALCLPRREPRPPRVHRPRPTTELTAQ
jgi:hypothetical protein